MKKSLIILGALALVLLLTAFALPILFKGRIQQAVDSTLAESIKARVSYQDLDLSLFRRFPNLSLTVEKLSLVGIERFEGDTLMASDKITLSLNPFQAMFSDNLEIKQVELLKPKIRIDIQEDGTANYHIAVNSEAEASQDSNFDFAIKHWSVEEGALLYHDQQIGLYTELQKISHEGSGDFSQDLFDLSTSSKVLLVALQYQGVEFVTNKWLDVNAILEMNLVESKFTFKDNQVSINEFSFGFDGWLGLPTNTDDILMNLTFETRENEFQHLLSCVPGVYQEEFNDLVSSGLVTMAGKIEGTYNDQQVPAFQLSLKISDGMFQYPDLPTAVNNINLNVFIANEDGNPDHTLIDISQLHIEFGQNPLDGQIRVDGLSTPEIKAELTTSLELAELTNILPMDGLTLKGRYELSLKANGVYDSAAQIFPVIDASMELENGFIKSAEFPESLEQINLVSQVSNHSGYLPDTRVEIPKFGFILDGEAFNGHLILVNPNNYSWELGIDGGVDLEKMTRVFPLEDMTVTGKLRGNLQSSGKMSSLEAERYADVPTSGEFSIENFTYTSNELDHPFEIHSGKASFTPQQINLNEIVAHTGSTDLTVNGRLSDYIGYLFQDNALIKGRMNIESENMNLNEWMSESTSSEETESLSVLEIPSNIEFELQAKAETVQYDNMELRNVRGQLLVKEGVVHMNDLSFNSLGGGFLISGTYDPVDLQHPTFDLGVEMQQISFKDAFNTFQTVKILAPVTQIIDGDFNSSFRFNGELQQDMMPLLGSLSGIGLVNIASANLSSTESKLLQGFTEVTRFNTAPDKFSLEDVVMAIQIKDGQLDVAPFSARFGEYQTIVSGSTGIDGTMNFLLNMEVPAGVVGTSVNQTLANLIGSNQPVDDKINVNIALSGNYNDPKFTLGGIQGENTTVGIAKSAAQQKSNEVKDSAKVLVNQEANKLTETAAQQLDSLITGNSSDSTSNDVIKDATKELLNKDKVDEVLNLFKKRKDKQQQETKD